MSSILTYLICMYKGCVVGLQRTCSALAACTGWLDNSNASHGVCEIEKLINDIHINILKMHMQRVCSWPAACLQHTCRAPAACTDWLENSNTSHGVCDIEKLTNDIHINILKMNMQRVCSQPAACLQCVQGV